MQIQCNEEDNVRDDKTYYSYNKPVIASLRKARY